MIPKIIHQTYKTKVLPEKYLQYQKSLLFYHPDWEYRLWTDEENESFLKDLYPQYYNVYKTIPIKIMQFDFIRYAYLYHFGGLYLDLDYEMLKSFDLINYNILLPRESDDQKPIFLGNSILASQPRHPFWEILLNTISKQISNLPEYISEDTVLNTTGPGMITNVYNSLASKEKIDIYIPPRLLFNPPIPNSKKEYDTLKLNNLSYGIHYCYGSWRALSLRKRLLNKIKKIFFSLKSKK